MTKTWNPFFLTAVILAILGVIGLAYTLMTGIILLVVALASALAGVLKRSRSKPAGPASAV